MDAKFEKPFYLQNAHLHYYFSCDDKGAILDANHLFTKHFGAIKTKDEPKLLTSLLHPTDAKYLKARLAEMKFAKGEPHAQFVLRFQHSENSDDYLEVSWECFCIFSGDKSANCIGYLFLGHHAVVQSREAIEGLRLEETEKRFETIYNVMQEGLVMHNSKGEIVTCNPASERILGLTYNQMIGKTSIDPTWRCIHEDGSVFEGQNHPAMVALASGKSISNVIMGVIKASGSLSWISVNADPLFLPDEDKPYAVFATFHDITERKEAEQAKKYSEKKYRNFFNLAPVGIAVNRLHDGMFIEVNHTFAEMVGFKEEELLAKSYHHLTPKRFEQLEQKKVKLLKSEGAYPFYEKTLIHASGEEVPVRLKGSLFKEGGISYIYNVVEDLRGEKDKEAQIKNSERKFRAIFNSTFQFTGLMKPDGTLIEANQTALDFAGIKASEVVKKKLWDAYWWSHSKAAQSKVKDAIQRAASGEFIRYNEEVLGQNESIRTIDFSLKPITDESGNVILLIPEGRDITDLVATQRLLEEAEARWRFAFESTNSGVWDYDADNKHFFLSKTGKQLLDLPAKDRVGVDDWLALLDEAKDTEFSQRWMQLLAGKEKSLDVELFLNGTQKWLQIKGKVIERDHYGKAKRIVGVLLDIDVLKKREKDLKRMLELRTTIAKMNKQNESLLNFAHVVSHNLKTHSGHFVSIMKLWEDAEGQKEKEELADMIRQSSASLAETVQNLTEVVDSYHQKEKFKKCIPLKGAIEKVVQSIFLDIEKTQATVKVDIPEEVEVEYNPAYLESIVLNLLTNALKYKHPDRKPVVNIDIQQVSTGVWVRVKDNGRGIDLQQFASKLFGLYQTFHRNPDAQGLGLYIVKNQVESMGGKIKVSSQVGKGSVFKVFIPMDMSH